MLPPWLIKSTPVFVQCLVAQLWTPQIEINIAFSHLAHLFSQKRSTTKKNKFGLKCQAIRNKETMRTTRHIWQSMWDTFKEHNAVGQHNGKHLGTSWGTKPVTQWKKIQCY